MHSRLAILLPLTAVIACGRGADDTADTMPASTPAQHSLMFMAQEFSFDGPDTVPAGFTRVGVMNHGAEPHHVLLVRLDSGHVAGELLDAFAKNRMPPWAVFLGGPNASDEGINEVVVELTPGDYVALCLIPSPDGTPHFAKGMVRQLSVIPSTQATTAPATDLTIALSDYAFTPSTALAAGRHVIRVDNPAAQPHELVIVRLEPGKTVRDYAAWVEKQEGPPPGRLVGGTTPQSSGVANYIVADFTPGEYGFFCFVPDAKDGRLHTAHGMQHQFTVQ